MSEQRRGEAIMELKPDQVTALHGQIASALHHLTHREMQVLAESLGHDLASGANIATALLTTADRIVKAQPTVKVSWTVGGPPQFPPGKRGIGADETNDQ